VVFEVRRLVFFPPSDPKRFLVCLRGFLALFPLFFFIPSHRFFLLCLLFFQPLRPTTLTTLFSRGFFFFFPGLWPSGITVRNFPFFFSTFFLAVLSLSFHHGREVCPLFFVFSGVFFVVECAATSKAAFCHPFFFPLFFEIRRSTNTLFSFSVSPLICRTPTSILLEPAAR